MKKGNLACESGVSFFLLRRERFVKFCVKPLFVDLNDAFNFLKLLFCVLLCKSVRFFKCMKFVILNFRFCIDF